jgi:hypothetical protein
MKTCHLYLTCTCSCHEELDKMFEMAEQPRILVENSEYVPDRGSYIMPRVEELLEARRERERQEGRESIAEADEAEILSGNVFAGTATGRRNPRQLEYQVLVACLKVCWPAQDVVPVTPKWIGEIIAEVEKIAPPSTGAIQAIWDRWVQIEFCLPYGRKPVRFLGFNSDEKPTVDSLDLAREQYKKTEKFAAASKRRVTLRTKR